MTYTKIILYYTKISDNKATPFFYRQKQEENPHAEIMKDPRLISRKKCCEFVFCFKNSKKYQKQTFVTCFYHIGKDFKEDFKVLM